MATTTLTLRVTGMHCASCPLLVDETLEDLPGVHDTHTSLRQQRSTVHLDTTQSSPAEVITAIRQLGYKAEQLD